MSAFNGLLGTPQRARISLRIHHNLTLSQALSECLCNTLAGLFISGIKERQRFSCFLYCFHRLCHHFSL